MKSTTVEVHGRSFGVRRNFLRSTFPIVSYRDKAIDLIDEAGSRVRLAHTSLPEEAKELDKELKALQKKKTLRFEARL